MQKFYRTRGELQKRGRCKGKGEIRNPNDIFMMTWIECPSCDGTGWVRV